MRLSQVTGAYFDLVLTSRERPSDMVYAVAFGTRDNENRFCRFIRRGGPYAANHAPSRSFCVRTIAAAAADRTEL